jgi:hypothetical protein
MFIRARKLKPEIETFINEKDELEFITEEE